MAKETKLNGCARYAWFLLGYNILVILWGVFLRSSKSGDGCGQHWITCNGETIPSAPQLKTVIEFSHRIMSALDGVLVLILLIFAFVVWRKLRTPGAKYSLYAAILSLFFVATEGAIGAGLVLTGNTAETLTFARPFWMAGHLVNTFILLACLTLAAWFAGGGGRLSLKLSGTVKGVLVLGIFGILLVGVTGSIAALCTMLFPSGTLSEGLASDFSSTSNVLLRIRPAHPFIAVLSAVYLVFASGWLKRESGNDAGVSRWSGILSIVLLCQLAFGAATLLTLAPIVMQIGHLLLADAVWVSFVMLAANLLASRNVVDQETVGTSLP